MPSSYNDINQSHLHYGVYGRRTGHNNYPIGHHHLHMHHPLHHFGGNSAIQHWDYPNASSGAPYLNQFGGSGYTTSLDTFHGSRRHRRRVVHRRY